MGLVLVFGVAVLALHTYIARRFPSITPALEAELPDLAAAPKPRRREQQGNGAQLPPLRGDDLAGSSGASLNGAVVLVPPAEGDGAPAGAGAEAAAGRLRAGGEASSSGSDGDGTGAELPTRFRPCMIPTLILWVRQRWPCGQLAILPCRADTVWMLRTGEKGAARTELLGCGSVPIAS